MVHKASWQSPSNIAIIKYWGKHGLQLPQNPSFSLTLSKARTETSVQYNLNDVIGRHINVWLDGEKKEEFVPKIEQFLDRLESDYPSLKNMRLDIRTHNTFPHSSGIASSASAMSALACCLGEILNTKGGKQELSRISRLGSGSACRSLFARGSVWGQSDHVTGSSDEFAIPFSDQMHDVFKSYQDAILIVKSGEKAVSSTAGHALMNDHPFSKNRYQNAHNRLGLLNIALKQGDVTAFGEICEAEALELHALMMCSKPPYILMEPGTLEIIQRIQNFRKNTAVPVYFTLDAGPNVHLLYPEENKDQVKNFIEADLVSFCENGFWIDDQVGLGPSKIEI